MSLRAALVRPPWPAYEISCTHFRVIYCSRRVDVSCFARCIACLCGGLAAQEIHQFNWKVLTMAAVPSPSLPRMSSGPNLLFFGRGRKRQPIGNQTTPFHTRDYHAHPFRLALPSSLSSFRITLKGRSTARPATIQQPVCIIIQAAGSEFKLPQVSARHLCGLGVSSRLFSLRDRNTCKRELIQQTLQTTQ